MSFKKFNDNNSIFNLPNKFGSKGHHEHIVTNGVSVPTYAKEGVWLKSNSNASTFSVYNQLSDIRVDKYDFDANKVDMAIDLMNSLRKQKISS